jgi:hypothetical protein
MIKFTLGDIARCIIIGVPPMNMQFSSVAKLPRPPGIPDIEIGDLVRFDDLTTVGKQHLTAILNYRNEAVVRRYADDHKVTLELAERTFKGLLQYLAVCGFTGGKRTPAKIIDECWHVFILHLKDYDDFCHTYMRGLVYHDPAIDDSGFVFYPITRQCAEALFGELDPEIWPTDHDLYARCISTKASEAARFVDLRRSAA